MSSFKVSLINITQEQKIYLITFKITLIVLKFIMTLLIRKAEQWWREKCFAATDVAETPVLGNQIPSLSLTYTVRVQYVLLLCSSFPIPPIHNTIILRQLEGFREAPLKSINYTVSKDWGPHLIASWFSLAYLSRAFYTFPSFCYVLIFGERWRIYPKKNSKRRQC